MPVVFVDSLGFPTYRIISVNKDSFTSSFPICMLLISFSCFIILARTLCIELNIHLCLVPGFGEKASSFTTKYDVSCRVFVEALYQVEGVPFYS